MRELTEKEVIEIEGGGKDRNILEIGAGVIGGAIGGVVGAIAGWLSR